MKIIHTNRLSATKRTHNQLTKKQYHALKTYPNELVLAHVKYNTSLSRGLRKFYPMAHELFSRIADILFGTI